MVGKQWKTFTLYDVSKNFILKPVKSQSNKNYTATLKKDCLVNGRTKNSIKMVSFAAK